jgi:hypothetical protein
MELPRKSAWNEREERRKVGMRHRLKEIFGFPASFK